MDSVRRTFFGRLTGSLGGLLLVVFVFFVSSTPAFAGTYAQAEASCQAYATANGEGQPNVSIVCEDDPNPANVRIVAFGCTYTPNCGTTPEILSGFPYSGSKPPTNPCAGMVPTTVDLPGRILIGYTMSVRGPVQPNGSQAMCTMNVTPVGRPYWNPYGDGGWYTNTGVSPTGNIAGVGQGTDGGIYNGSGQSAPDAPPAPDPLPSPSSGDPGTCNSAACYGSSGDSYCAQDASGANVACVGAGSGSGGAPGATSTGGGCSSAGQVTLCAGSPSPPIPSPATTGITDPATQVTATGTTTTADPSTGSVTTVSTTVYTSLGGSSSNGSPGASSGSPPTISPGSSGGPAGSSSSPAHSGTSAGSFGGGTSCNVPPVCSGDAVMCGIARTQWSTTCLVHTDLAGTSAPPSLASQTAGLTGDKVWVDPASNVDGTVGGQANAGNYDASGGGAGRTCPLTDFHFASVSALHVDLSKGCDPLWWLGLTGEGFAVFAAIRITAGSNT